MVLSFVLRWSFCFFIHILAKLTSLDEFFDLFFKFPTLIGVVAMILVILIVLGGVPLLLRDLHFLRFRQLTRVQLSIDLPCWNCERGEL